MIKKNFSIYILISILAFSPCLQAKNSCSELLRSSKTTLTLTGFSETNLVGLEVIASAVLASRLGRKGQMLTQRENSQTNEIDAARAKLNDLVTVQQLTNDITGFVLNSVTTDKSFDIKRFIRADSKNSEASLLEINSIITYLDSAQGQTELSAFIEANLSAIKKNAEIMPLENSLRVILRRSFNKPALFTAITLNSLPIGLAVADLTSGDQWAGLVALFVLTVGLPTTALTSVVAAPAVGSFWASRSGSPIFDLSGYDMEIGADVRAEFAAGE